MNILRLLRLNRTSIAIVVVLLMMGTSLAFAFWDQTEVTRQETDIILGEGAILTVEQVVNTNQRLIPVGSFKGEGDVDEVIMIYNVIFNKLGQLSVSIPETSIQIGQEPHAFHHLAILQLYINDKPIDEIPNLALLASFNEDNGTYEIQINVRIIIVGPKDPADNQAAYEAILGRPLRFDIMFEALPINES